MADSLYRKLYSMTTNTDSCIIFDSIADFLPVIFRTIGGRKSVKFITLPITKEKRPFGFQRCLGKQTSSIKAPSSQTELIAMPAYIDYFPELQLNKDLYIWLAIFFASSEPHQIYEPNDLLLSDLYFIRQSYHTTLRAKTFYKEFSCRYQTLAKAMLESRKERDLPHTEQDIEGLIRSLIGDKSSEIKTGHIFFDYVVHGIPLPSTLKAPQHYKPMHPLPLWGEFDPAIDGKNAAQSQSRSRDKKKSQLPHNFQ